MKKEDCIFVAGGRGLVGSAVIRALLRGGYENIVASYFNKRPAGEDFGEKVRWVRIDLRRQGDVESFFESNKVDYVFLCAAKVGGILANSTYRAEFIYDNVMISTNVINSAHKYGVKKLLNLGSSCIYPKGCLQPMKEEYLLSGKLEPTNEPYAIAKICALKMCRFYNEQYRTNFVSLMPTNLYGPGDNFHLENSHVLPAMMRKFMLAKWLMQGKIDYVSQDLQYWERLTFDDEDRIYDFLSEKGIYPGKVVLWGDGMVYREFLFVDDLADAMVFFMNEVNFDDVGEFVNVGWGKDILLLDLAKKISSIVGFDGEILWDESKPKGVKRKLLDVSRMKKLGFEPKVDLDTGIRKTFKWYLREFGYEVE